jgi:hypothetical protein
MADEWNEALCMREIAQGREEEGIQDEFMEKQYTVVEQREEDEICRQCVSVAVVLKDVWEQAECEDRFHGREQDAVRKAEIHHGRGF